MMLVLVMIDGVVVVDVVASDSDISHSLVVTIIAALLVIIIIIIIILNAVTLSLLSLCLSSRSWQLLLVRLQRLSGQLVLGDVRVFPLNEILRPA
jgi:hypothetical protein